MVWTTSPLPVCIKWVKPRCTAHTWRAGILLKTTHLCSCSRLSVQSWLLACCWLLSCLLLLINFATHLRNFCSAFEVWEFRNWDLCLSCLPLLPVLQTQALRNLSKWQHCWPLVLAEEMLWITDSSPSLHNTQNMGQVPGSPQQTHHSVCCFLFFFSIHSFFLLYLYPVTCKSLFDHCSWSTRYWVLYSLCLCSQYCFICGIVLLDY